jgi:hypothetical protein
LRRRCARFSAEISTGGTPILLGVDPYKALLVVSAVDLDVRAPRLGRKRPLAQPFVFSLSLLEASGAIGLDPPVASAWSLADRRSLAAGICDNRNHCQRRTMSQWDAAGAKKPRAKASQDAGRLNQSEKLVS